MEALPSIILPVALVVLTGYLAGPRLGLDLSTLSRLSVYVLVPALIFQALREAELGKEGTLGLLLGYLLTALSLFLLAQGLGRLLRLRPTTARSLVLAALFPNTGNLGLSLVLFALGEEGLTRAVLYFILSSLLMFGLGPALVQGGGLGEGLRLTLRLPLVYALALGLLLRGVPIPFRLDEGLALHPRAPPHPGHPDGQDPFSGGGL